MCKCILFHAWKKTKCEKSGVTWATMTDIKTIAMNHGNHLRSLASLKLVEPELSPPVVSLSPKSEWCDDPRCLY